jgi:hypothetical protein
LGRKDSNAAEWIKGEQIQVTGNQVGRVATYGKLKEFVILGISASLYPDVNFDPLCLARQSCDEASNIFFINVSAELFAG